MDACRSLRSQGYALALDDFVPQPRLEPLTHIATLIKIEVHKHGRREQETLLETYHQRGIRMVAEKVETQKQFEWASRAGYDLFQGYFFAQPVIVRGRQVPASKTACLRLRDEMQKPELDYGCLQELISKDVSLSYKLLSYVNSALFHARSEIHSIDFALALLGETEIRHWIALAALVAMAKDRPGELVTHSLVRARFCERMAELAGIQEHNGAFLAGLLSFLDALPLDEALEVQQRHRVARTVAVDNMVPGTIPAASPN